MLIDCNDPLLLTHFNMHNVLFLVRNEYNVLTSKKPPAVEAPSGYQAVTNFCHLIQVARNSVTTVPPPVTAQEQAHNDIMEVMAEAIAKVRFFLCMQINFLP